MTQIVRVRRAVLDELLAAAHNTPEMECCGLLAGHEDVISAVLPARNALASATSFEIAPADLFSMVRKMRAANLQLLGIYHSHPRGENAPSSRDVERAFYPDVAYFIISPQPDTSRPVRAFRIRDGRASELILQSL